MLPRSSASGPCRECNCPARPDRRTLPGPVAPARGAATGPVSCLGAFALSTTLLQSDLPGLNRIHRGKVRDVFDLGDGHLLMVATDRLSAFDVVLPDPIPGKGEMLCQISNFWFERTRHIIDNHLTGIDVASVLPAGVDPALYAKRAVVTKKLTPVPVECIARGYIIGSGWKDYQRTGEVSGIRLPEGLQQAQQLRLLGAVYPVRETPRMPYKRLRPALEARRTFYPAMAGALAMPVMQGSRLAARRVLGREEIHEGVGILQAAAHLSPPYCLRLNPRTCGAPVKRRFMGPRFR